MVRAISFRDTLRQALTALHENRRRTVLSVLGVAVGVAAVIVVGTITQTGHQLIFAEFETYGLRSLWIYRDLEQRDPYRTAASGSGILPDDIKQLATSGCCPAVARVSGEVYQIPQQVLVYADNNFLRAPVSGIDSEYLSINNDSVVAGVEFRPDDIAGRRQIALIGTGIHEELFGLQTNPIGKGIRLHDLRFTVTGILKEKDRSLLMQLGAESNDINKRVLIPVTVYQNIFQSRDIHQIRAEAVDLARVNDALEQITEYLSRRHNKVFSYRAESMLGWIGTANYILNLVSLIGFVSASISLLVGGIGIANIMSTSVVERTREIGIRKAIGARDTDILRQFLWEAIYISGVGALWGLVVGGVAVAGISYWVGHLVLPPLWIVVTAVATSSLVGMLSGYFPARRAARMRPVDALRYE